MNTTDTEHWTLTDEDRRTLKNFRMDIPQFLDRESLHTLLGIIDANLSEIRTVAANSMHDVRAIPREAGPLVERLNTLIRVRDRLETTLKGLATSDATEHLSA